MVVYLHSFLNMAGDRGDCLASRFSRFIPKEDTRHSSYIWGCVDPKGGVDVLETRNIFFLPEIQPLIFGRPYPNLFTIITELSRHPSPAVSNLDLHISDRWITIYIGNVEQIQWSCKSYYSAFGKSLCTYKRCWKWCPRASIQAWTHLILFANTFCRSAWEMFLM
jgi:hypothetical protein